MIYTAKDHTFCVCAYKESPYLASCIRSLLTQTERGHILIATSTPNDHIRRIADEFGIKLYEHDAAPDIAGDWNYAYSKARTPLVTIAHQDDIYNKEFLVLTLKALNGASDPILAHTGYYEIRDGKPVMTNRLLRIKRILLLPFVTRFTWNSRFLRRRSLAFGCGICCPSVTFVRSRLPEEPFETGKKADLDWQAWERYSRLHGAFCYVKKPVMGHRVHEGSETSNVIGDGDGRTAEDYEIYRKFWPKPIARLLIHFYKKGQDSNKLA